MELDVIYNQDCIKGMQAIPDKSIHMILCDLPYGTTACKWDSIIPFEELWKEYCRIIKDNGAIILFGSEPFTSVLICSQIKLFRYDLIWDKQKGCDFLNANRKPLKSHENILVFYKKSPTYNKQYWYSTPYKKVNGNKKQSSVYHDSHNIVILHESKEYLHQLRKEIDEYFRKELKLTIKENWQVFPTFKRGIDYVGYRSFLEFTLLRKSTCKGMKKKMVAINKKRLNGLPLTYSEWCSINSYKGWLIHCDGYRLEQKYIQPLQQYADQFYIQNIKMKG